MNLIGDIHMEILDTFKKICAKCSKISIKDNYLLKEYCSKVAIISSFVGIISFCIPSVSSWKWRVVCLLLFVVVLVAIFISDWYKANQLLQANLKINGTSVNVKIGDLFMQEGLKVIGVNNYFDLVADDVVISKATLHGKFVLKHQDEIKEIEKAIENSQTLVKDDISGRRNMNSYDYGSCVIYNDYVLTALTKFDLKNKAYTSLREYIQFWIVFWDNMDVICNSQTINIPIMGAGQTRFRGIRPKKQELIEIALWALKESGFQINYVDKSINFIIYERDAPDINFYHIQRMFG